MDNCVLVKGLLVLPDVRQIFEYVWLEQDIIVPHPRRMRVLMTKSVNNSICTVALVFCTIYNLVPTEETDVNNEHCTTAVWAGHEGAVSGLGFSPPEPKAHQ